MSRAERLLELIEVLRRHRFPVAGPSLAQQTGVSLRTLYRDIASLRAQGAPIEGEPGLGYVLRPGFTLPPLMFREDEIEALLLGTQWVAERTDHRLRDAARNALAKVSDVLPSGLRSRMEASTLLVGPAVSPATDTVDMAVVRDAIQAERKLAITYRRGDGDTSQRLVWPFALGFFDDVRVIVAWCELRRDIRHFRGDRIERLVETGERYPRRRNDLMKEWRRREEQNPPA